jgi:monoamine oxidase
VAILGGGIAGLVSAFELRKAGFACTVIEARERPGGRNWSVRNGSKIEFTDGTVQTCDWEKDNYLNVGPARLPSIHRTILGYCEELGVPLEVEINTSRSTLMQAATLNGGKPVEQRQAINDTRGYVSELLAKSIDQHGLDKALSKEDTARMLEFLRQYGDLKSDYSYQGSARSGYLSPPGAGPKEEKLRAPLSLHELLISDFTANELFEDQIVWQATMFQPVGGMDRIAYAFAKSLGGMVRYRCPVKRVAKTAAGVRVEYTEAGSSARQTIEADYCICTLPLSIADTRHRLFRGEEAGVQRHEARVHVQDRMGGAALLGKALQHLWRHVLPEADGGPRLVPEQRVVYQDGYYSFRFQL